MARKYAQQYQNTRDRVQEHRDRFVDPTDADRILRMADAYDPDNFRADSPPGQQTNAVTALKNYLTGVKKTAVHVALTRVVSGGGRGH